MRDGVCLISRKLWEEVEKGEAAMPAGRSLGRLLDELLSGRWLTSLKKCVRERLCKDMVRVLDGNVQMVFV